MGVAESIQAQGGCGLRLVELQAMRGNLGAEARRHRLRTAQHELGWLTTVVV